ncbi:MAG TPA: hypothetical protein PKD51_19095 [Saprospiraceae bacterium]|nr:hypothetical protein [Saprospiraceae bacterium]
MAFRHATGNRTLKYRIPIRCLRAIASEEKSHRAIASDGTLTNYSHNILHKYHIFVPLL